MGVGRKYPSYSPPRWLRSRSWWDKIPPFSMLCLQGRTIYHKKTPFLGATPFKLTTIWPTTTTTRIMMLLPTMTTTKYVTKLWSYITSCLQFLVCFPPIPLSVSLHPRAVVTCSQETNTCIFGCTCIIGPVPCLYVYNEQVLHFLCKRRRPVLKPV